MISIILPTYNEAKNIAHLLEEIDSNLKFWDYEVVLVDDNSPDHTADVALKLRKRFPLKIVKRSSKLGLSSAVIAGIDVAKGSIIGVMDADLSHPPSKIPELVKAIEKEKCDLVIGSRLIKGGCVESWPFYRKMISQIATLLSRPLTNVDDPMSGFFFFKKDILKGVKLNAIGYKILLEILVKGNQKKVKEIPYTFRNREFGESKINFKIYLDYLRHVFSLYLYKLCFR